MKTKLVTLVLLSLLWSGCAEPSHEGSPSSPAADNGGGGGDGGGGGGLGDPKALDFAIVKAQIFTPRCVRCHQEFADYAKVALELNQIQDAVLTNRMPPRGPLSDELKGLLTEWIGNGAPEITPEPGG